MQIYFISLVTFPNYPFAMGMTLYSYITPIA